MIMRNIKISLCATEGPKWLAFNNSPAQTLVEVSLVAGNPEAKGWAYIEIAREIRTDWLLDLNDAMFMKQMINGVIDGEVIPAYAKYAIEHMANEHGGKL